MKIGHFSKNDLLVIILFLKTSTSTDIHVRVTTIEQYTVFCAFFFSTLRVEGIVYVKIYSKLSNGNEISPDLSLIVMNKIHELRKAFELIYKCNIELQSTQLCIPSHT